MSGLYARETSVSVEKSRAELEALLRRYGGVGFAYATDDRRAQIGFKIKAGDEGGVLAVRMDLPMPDPEKESITHRRTGPHSLARRSSEAALKAWDQECRAVWRSLVLVVKAKLEACAVGISTVEREFMADIIMPDGRTLTECLGPDIARMLASGKGGQLCLPGV